MLMRCKQIAKQTRGEVNEIELDKSLYCSQAAICRRNGICTLSPFSCQGQIRKENRQSESTYIEESFAEFPYRFCYEVLNFKHSLGYQWLRMTSFAEAVLLLKGRSEKGEPKIIRRVEYLQLPD